MTVAGLSHDSDVAVDIDRPDHGPKARWRRSALRSCSGKARAITLIAVLTAVFNRQMESFVGNGWLQDETGLDERSIRYGLGDLVKAKQITVDLNGPKRVIRAIVPPALSVEKAEQIIPGKAEQIVPGRADRKAERFRSKAGINRSAIVGSRLPLPPRTELARSVALAAARDVTPFRPGEFPAWMDDEASPLLAPDLRPAPPLEKPMSRSDASSTPGQSDEPERCKLDHPANSSTVRDVEVPHASETDLLIPKSVLSLLGGGDVAEGRRLAEVVPPDRLAEILDFASKFGASACRNGIAEARELALSIIARRASA